MIYSNVYITLNYGNKMLGKGKEYLPFIFTTCDSPEFLLLLSNLDDPLYAFFPNEAYIYGTQLANISNLSICIPIWTKNAKVVMWENGAYMIRNGFSAKKGALFNKDNPFGFMDIKYLHNVCDILRAEESTISGKVASSDNIIYSLWKSRRNIKFKEISQQSNLDLEKLKGYVTGNYIEERENL